MPAPRFGKHCYFSEDAVIAGDVEMGDDCTVWFNAVVRGDVHFIKIGNRTNIQDNSCLHTLNGKAPCILGDDVVEENHTSLVTVHNNPLALVILTCNSKTVSIGI